MSDISYDIFSGLALGLQLLSLYFFLRNELRLAYAIINIATMLWILL